MTEQALQSKATIASWVEEYTEMLYNRACYATGENLVAEDLVQDTFLAALQSFHTFRNESNPKTWLFSILNHKIADHHRKAYRSIEAVLDSIPDNGMEYFDKNGTWKNTFRPEPADLGDPNLLDDPEFRSVLEECVDELPPKWHSVIQMKFLDEKNADEICQDLAVSPSNYWQLLHRAKLRLRHCIELLWFKS